MGSRGPSDCGAGLQGTSRCSHGSPGLPRESGRSGPHVEHISPGWLRGGHATGRQLAGPESASQAAPARCPALSGALSDSGSRAPDQLVLPDEHSFTETSTLNLHWFRLSDSCGNSPGEVGTPVSTLPPAPSPGPPLAGISCLPWRNMRLWGGELSPQNLLGGSDLLVESSLLGGRGGSRHLGSGQVRGI